ncbi:hypothetical protein EMCRGX_G022310 [Ephydatia muelleri]|eukprot:Em0009g1065a
MASALFQSTPSLKKAAGIINELESEKFGKLLARIIQKLHLKDEPAFNADEQEKLLSALQLDPRGLELVLETTTFVLQQTAYHIAKVAVLKEHLQNIGLNEEKITMFVQTWTSQGKAVLERLRSRAFYPYQLEESNWRLSLQMAQASKSRLKVPNALFEFVVNGDEEKDKIHVEFSHEELYDFYTKLECIQQQLDSLT